MISIRQLVAQTASYQLQGGSLNSTVPPPSAEPFQASVLDIRVNILWFASLLFSLITASFGILVKQWLREFLAADNPSPLARLRVRHLRYPQLVQWKVFEIAAVLPLLLQLALALFFAGLCYFTASVHPSVEHTTLPLVLGWAFCFCSVIAFPLFFPGCPYRTALLKGWVQSLHRKISSGVQIRANIYQPFLSAPKFPPPPGPSWFKRVVYDAVGRWSSKHDESRAIQLPEKDIEILASVDSIQSNDQLLGTAIAEAVDHLHCGHAQFEQFLRTILENRGHQSGRATDASNPLNQGCTTPFPLPILNLRLVSKQARNAICSVVTHYVTNTLFDIGPDDILSELNISGEVYKTTLMCMIMLSVSDCTLPKDGLYLLQGPRFSAHGWHAMSMLIREALNTVDDGEGQEYRRPEDKVGLLLQGLGRLWEHLEVGTGPLLRTVYHSIAAYVGIEKTDFCRVVLVNWEEVDDWALDRLSPQARSDFTSLLVHATASILRKGYRTYKDEDCDLHITFRAILRLSYAAGDWPCDISEGKAFDFILSVVLTEPDLTRVFIDTFLQAPFPWVYVLAVRFPDRLASLNPIYGIDLDEIGA